MNDPTNPRLLCLHPEVMDLALFAASMVDELDRKGHGDCWHEGEGKLASLDDAIIDRLAAIGIKAEVVESAGNGKGKKKRSYLALKFADGLSDEQMQKANEDYSIYRAAFRMKTNEVKENEQVPETDSRS